MIKVSDLVIKFLESKKINTTFTVSGGGCIHLIDSLRQSQINTICPHHEQSALMASEGYYRMSGNLAANIVTTGPGGTNTITGLLGLWLDSIPTIVISGQVSSSQLSASTGCRQIGDQEFDIVGTIKTMTKYAKMITDPYSILYELEKAYEIATSGRPGPVWIDIPLDIQGMNIDETKLKIYTETKEELLINQNQIDKLISLLSSSKRPLIIVGNGIRLSKTYEKLNEFLTKTKIPVVTGPHSGVDCVDNTLEYYSGRIGILGQLTSNQIVQEADLILALGTRLPVKMTGYNVSSFSPNSKKIIVDIDINEIKKHKFNIDLAINCDLMSFFSSMENFDIELNIEEWQTTVKSIRANQQYFYDKHRTIQNYASFYYLMNKASNIFNNVPIITSNGTAHVVTLQTYQLSRDQRLFTNVGCASMGYGLPAAIGACIANDNKQVICVEGDGSIMMNLQELQTIVGYNLPVKILLVNNDGYLSIKLSQESFFAGKEFASGPTNGVTIPSFEKLANAFGIHYMKITNNDEIDSVLKKMIDHPTACIVEVFTHPMERHEPKVVHKGIDENGKIIPGTLTDMFVSEGF